MHIDITLMPEARFGLPVLFSFFFVIMCTAFSGLVYVYEFEDLSIVRLV